MLIIRPIQKNDLEYVIKFAFKSGIGVRNLPKNAQRLEEKVECSIASFAKQVHEPLNEEYLFVLEDLSTGKIEGTCGIMASINPEASQCFKIATMKNKINHPSAIKEIKILKPVKVLKQASEVCSLYLNPDSRHEGLGRLLSLSRFLFIASNPNRFRKNIIAELRGFIDRDNNSPFWDAIGKNFIKMTIEEIMFQIDHNQINISKIIPPFPIYIDLLPQEAKDIIGKTHEKTKGALYMLEQEGFRFTQEIDVIEGGPKYIAPFSKIRSIKKSRLAHFEIIEENIDDLENYILSNTSMNFRACYAKIKFQKKTSKILINKHTVDALHLKTNETIRFISAHPT